MGKDSSYRRKIVILSYEKGYFVQRGWISARIGVVKIGLKLMTANMGRVSFFCVNIVVA